MIGLVVGVPVKCSIDPDLTVASLRLRRKMSQSRTNVCERFTKDLNRNRDGTLKPLKLLS